MRIRSVGWVSALVVLAVMCGPGCNKAQPGAQGPPPAPPAPPPPPPPDDERPPIIVEEGSFVAKIDKSGEKWKSKSGNKQWKFDQDITKIRDVKDFSVDDGKSCKANGTIASVDFVGKDGKLRRFWLFLELHGGSGKLDPYILFDEDLTPDGGYERLHYGNTGEGNITRVDVIDGASVQTCVYADADTPKLVISFNHK